MRRKFFYILCMLFSVTVFAENETRDGVMEKGYDVAYLWDAKSGYSNPNWMSTINRDLNISRMSIPGTHNSLSLYGGDIPKTQTLDIPSQLEMGIRYLDVRFKLRNNNLLAYHGPVYQYSTFNDLLFNVSAFLKAHPSETVLIRIQNEDGSNVYAEEFYKKFNDILNPYKSLNVIPNNDNPLLGDIQGKFVFIRDFYTNGDRIGIERGALFIQDNYTLRTNWDLYSKWNNVKQHFYSNTGSKISLNYLSASTGSFPYFVASGKSSPQTHAPQLWTGVVTTNRGVYPDFPRVSCLGSLCSVMFKGINQLTVDWIDTGRFPKNLGIVVMDFPGGKLVRSIIKTN